MNPIRMVFKEYPTKRRLGVTIKIDLSDFKEQILALYFSYEHWWGIDCIPLQLEVFIVKVGMRY